MKQSRTGMRILAGIVALIAFGGCVTVNVYFPAPEVRRAAEEIIDETWGSSASPPPAATESPLGTSERQPLTSWSIASAPAYAQNLDVNVSTAAIRSLKDQMKTRSGELKPHLQQGRVGIGKDGLLVARNLDGLALGDQATVRRLIEAENRDRQALYREIAKANNFGEERVPDVQRIFAEAFIAKAEPGWWVEQGGSWKKK